MRLEKVSSEYYATERREFLDALQVREPVDVVGLSGGHCRCDRQLFS